MSAMDDVRRLEADLTELANVIPGKVEQAVQQTAIRTKQSWASQARGEHPLGAQYADSIDYEVRTYGAFGQTVIAAEIGPDLARYGGKTGAGGLVPSMGVLDEPMHAPVDSKPIRAGRVAFEMAEEELAKGIEIALDQSLRAQGL